MQHDHIHPSSVKFWHRLRVFLCQIAIEMEYMDTKLLVSKYDCCSLFDI